MKYKIKANKKKAETQIEYFKVQDKVKFRYDTLMKLLNDKTITIMIDTNLSSNNLKAVDVVSRFETYFEQNNIPIEFIPTATTKEMRLFGVKVKTIDPQAYLIVFELECEHITEAFFSDYLSDFDLMIGWGAKKTFAELTKSIHRGLLTRFFDKEYFENALYDSKIVSTMRTTLMVDSNFLN